MISDNRRQSRLMTFASYLPNGCPPAKAEPASGIVYRLVKRNPPTVADFLTHHETEKLPGADPCLRCGLSVFRAKLDAIHQRNSYPKLGEYVAEGTLQTRHGVAMLTSGRQPSHMTWWPFEGIDRSEPFPSAEKIA
jgi:hypothetical protein